PRLHRGDQHVGRRTPAVARRVRHRRCRLRGGGGRRVGRRRGGAVSAVFRDADAGWVAALIVVLPLVIIGIGEVEERLRQNDASLRRSIAILRTWVVPLFAVWALLEVLVDPDPESPAMRLVESLLILTLSASALAALGVLIGRLRDRPRAAGRRTL